MRYVLAPYARIDLRDILRYSLRTWGVPQRDAYRQTLIAGLERLAQYPDLGMHRPEYGDGVKRHTVGEHIVIYRIVGHHLHISRILHTRQDIARELAELT